MKRPLLTTAAALFTIVVLVVAGCAYFISRYNRAFEVTSTGEPLASVLSRFGDPSVREVPSAPFLRYATSSCQDPCALRLWWEHPYLRGLEAWSVDIDSSNQVVHKAHWVSP
jgi:hypothetical protein